VPAGSREVSFAARLVLFFSFSWTAVNGVVDTVVVPATGGVIVADFEGFTFSVFDAFVASGFSTLATFVAAGFRAFASLASFAFFAGLVVAGFTVVADAELAGFADLAVWADFAAGAAFAIFGCAVFGCTVAGVGGLGADFTDGAFGAVAADVWCLAFGALPCPCCAATTTMPAVRNSAVRPKTNLVRCMVILHDGIPARLRR
jgi:hypothetical protein